MDDVRKVLGKFAWGNPPSIFKNLYIKDYALPYQSLVEFLHSTMDDVRIRHGAIFANDVVNRCGFGDALLFRHNVLMRELATDFPNNYHRDHTCHTLYNFLLGWFIYENCPQVKSELVKHFKRRCPKMNDSYFGEVWPLVSILHDVGYAFEGRIPPSAIQEDVPWLEISVKKANDFFTNQFWSDLYFSGQVEREEVKQLLKIKLPDFSGITLGAVSAALCTLDTLETIRISALKKYRKEKFPKGEIEYLKSLGGVPNDPFELWKHHYEDYENKSMVDRITQLRVAYQRVQKEGLQGRALGVRLLDHGVCGGLLLLNLLTTSLNVHSHSLEKSTLLSGINKERIERLTRAFKGRPQHTSLNPLWWWTTGVWGCAAVALHNIQQSRKAFGLSETKMPPLRLSDDPLTYLGILVDCIQEWDRPPTEHLLALVGNMPLQGNDVSLRVEINKIKIKFNARDKLNSDRAKAVRATLDGALADWKAIVMIEP